MHNYIEKFLLGKLNLDLLGDNTRERMMAEQIIENGLRNRLQEIWGCEATLHHPEKKYAGACDLVGVYEGYQSILDYKQSNSLRKDEWNSTYYMQLGAYSLAHNAVYGTNIDQGVILVCTKDNTFQRFVIYGDQLKEYQNKFLQRLEQYYSQKNI